MGVPLNLPDVVQVVKPKLSSDGYAMEVIDEIVDVQALFVATTGYQHADWQSNINSDASVYLDPENDFVIDNANRLEGMLVIANPFGEDDTQAWYKIATVIVGQDKLLANQIDNVQCLLKKTKEIPYVS